VAIVDELIAILGYEVEGQQEVEKFRRGVDKAEKGVDAFATTATRARAATKQFTAGVKSALGPLKSFAADASLVAKRVGVATGLLGGLAVNEGREFEDSMADVNKILDLTPDKLAAMSANIREMSRDIPLAASGLADIVAEAAQAGIAATDLDRFTRFAGKASTAFDIDPKQVGQDFATLRNVLGLTQDKMESLGDTVNHLSNNMNAKAEQIINFARRAAGSAKLFGVTGEELSGLGASLIALGVIPETAARGVSALANRVRKDSAKISEAFDSVGISQQEFLAKLDAGQGQQALLELFTRLGELDTTTASRALSELVGADFADDFVKVGQNIGILQQGFKLATDEAAKLGSVQREFESRVVTTTSKWIKLKNTLYTLAAGPVNAILDGFKAVADTVQEIVDLVKEADTAAEGWQNVLTFTLGMDDAEAAGVVEFFTTLKEIVVGAIDTIQATIATLRSAVDGVFGEGAFDAAVVKLTSVLGKAGIGLSKFLASTGTAGKTLTTLAGYLKLVAAPVRALATLVPEFAKGFAQGLAQGVANAGKAGQAITAFLNAIKGGVKTVLSFASSAAKIGKGILSIGKFAGKAVPGLNLVIGAITGLVDAIVVLANGGSATEAIAAFIGGIWDTVVGFPLMLADWAAEVVKFLTFGFVDFTGITSTLREWLSWDNIADIFTSWYAGLEEWVGKVTGFVSKVGDVVGGLFGSDTEDPNAAEEPGLFSRWFGGDEPAQPSLGRQLAVAGATPAAASALAASNVTSATTNNRGGDTFNVSTNVSQTVNGQTAPDAAADSVNRNLRSAAQRRRVYEQTEAGR